MGKKDQQPRGLERNVVVMCISFFILTLGYSLWYQLFSVYLDSIGLTTIWIGTVMTGYNASVSLTSMPSGRFSDRVGRRTPIMIGGSLIIIITFLLNFSKEPISILLLMISFGFSMGLMVPSANALIAESISSKHSGIAYSGFYVSMQAANIVGSALSGFIASQYGYSSWFFLGILLTMISVIFMYVYIKENMLRKSSYIAEFKNSVTTSFSGTISLLRSEKELTLLTIALSIHSFSFYLLYPYVSLFAVKSIFLNETQAGIVVSFWMFGITMALFPAGLMTDKLGGRITILIHVILSSFSWSLYTISQNFQIAIITMFIFGSVAALDMPARRAIMMEFSTEESGNATIIGTLDSITGMSGIIAPFIGGIIWNTFGYYMPFIIGSLINLCASIPLLSLARRKRVKRNY